MKPEVENDIKIPPPNYREKWSFHRLDVGDSFAITYEDEKEVVRLRTAASAYGQRHHAKLTTRTVYEDGIKKLRVWRVK